MTTAPRPLLTEVIGRRLPDDTGGASARIADLALRPHASPPVVTALVVQDPPRRSRASATRDDPAGDLGPVLAALPRRRASDGRRDPLLATDELLLCRDVLDTAVVDVVGHHLARVSDVLLEIDAEGRLLVVGVDVGVGGILRRLGMRGPAGLLRSRVLPWRTLHLTSSRGHELQLEQQDAPLHRLDADDLSHLVTRLPAARAADVLRVIDPRRAAQALARAHPAVRGRLATPTPVPTGRRFRRFSGWRVHRPPRGSGSR